jgi:dihydrofolate reductase
MPIYFYGAISLDGFLADKNHDIAWLTETQIEEPTSYESFYKTMDVVVMGKKTYDYISDFPNLSTLYPTTQNYVLTHHKESIDTSFIAVEGSIINLLQQFDSNLNVWIVGGNTLLKPLFEANMLDYLYIQIAPVVLSEGIKLFTSEDTQLRYQLIETKTYGQLVELIYKKGDRI